MSKIRLYGETSGFVELAAPDVANNVTITLPNDTSAFATEEYADNANRLVAVKHALFTGTQTNSTATRANFAVTDLSITHTLADAANKLIISAYLGAAGNSKQRANVGIGVADDGTLINLGDADGNRTRVSAGGFVAPADFNLLVTMPSVTFVYLPGDTASHTYTVRAINIDGDTQTLFVNRSESDTDAESRIRATSGFVIQEVRP
jgi:hypothetical protein